MKLLREHNNSIFFVQDGTKLIEYNILSSKHIIHISVDNDAMIYNYYISEMDKIIIIKRDHYEIIWNNKVIKTLIQRASYVNINFLKIMKEIYICIYVHFFRTLLYDFSGRYYEFACKVNNTINYDISSFCNSVGHEYGLNYIAPVENIVTVSKSKLRTLINRFDYDHCPSLVFLNGCDHLLYRYVGVIRYIHNIETCTEKATTKCFNKYFANSTFLFERTKSKMRIYDSASMCLLKTIVCCAKFRIFHKGLNVLVSLDDIIECYALTNQYELTKIKYGCNYIIDMVYIVGKIKHIMDVLNEAMDLPPEILNIELYQQLLLIVVIY